MPKRNGTNFQDRNRIKEYVDQGVTDPGRIAANLNLMEGPVASYVDLLLNPPKPKPKPKRKPRKPQAETEAPEQTDSAGEEAAEADSPFGAAAEG
jgi:hypothetical protein